MTHAVYEAIAFQFEQIAMVYGLVIQRRYPGAWGYEYNLALPGEDPVNGSRWVYCLEEETAEWLVTSEAMRLQIAYIAEQLLAKRMAA